MFFSVLMMSVDIFHIIIKIIKRMVKSTGSDKTKSSTKHTKKLHMGSQDMRTLGNFMKKLQRQFANKQAKGILPKIHTIIKQNKKKIYFDYRRIKEKLRICKACDKWNKINDIIQCSICQDNYHTKCIVQGTSQSPFKCDSCKKGGICAQCKKSIPQKGGVSCKDCNLMFHIEHMKDKRQKCKKCIKLQKKKIDPSQQDLASKYKKKIINQDTISTYLSQSALFRYERLIKTENQLQKYTSSLLDAISDKKMQYTQELINLGQHGQNLSEKSMDFGINFMNEAEISAYEMYKEFPIGPYLFRMIPGKGYDVVADKLIPQKTLICQYIGQVVTLRQCIELQRFGHNDSLMQLQSGKNSDQTLIIRPERFTNMARFINGVKKNSNDGNVETLKLIYKGKPLVLLVAKREIKKGESLCYDYNAGGIAAQYDTSNFL